MNSVYEWFQQTNKLYLTLAVIIIILVVYYIVRVRGQNQKSAETFTEEKRQEMAIPDKTRPAKLSLFYAEWCGWSRKFLPEWDAFEKYVADNKLNIAVEKVNCEKEGEKCSGIPHFPCVVLTRANGEKGMMDDKYPRTTDGLIKFFSESV